MKEIVFHTYCTEGRRSGDSWLGDDTTLLSRKFCSTSLINDFQYQQCECGLNGSGGVDSTHLRPFQMRSAWPSPMPNIHRNQRLILYRCFEELYMAMNKRVVEADAYRQDRISRPAVALSHGCI